MTTPRINSPGRRNDATRKELYELAKAHDIQGRSTMSKAELRAAVEQAATPRDTAPAPDAGTANSASRFEQFRALANEAARGQVVMLPRLLKGHDRRLHVRQTLLEDNHARIDEHGDEAAAKMDKLAGSLFAFFRGTALLFYRDMAGEDGGQPTVLALGDVHPGNFGVMPNADNVPIFGVNDFDEACYAPFTWDLKRGTLGFMIAAEEEGRHGRKTQRKIARRFLRGYMDGISRFAAATSEQDQEIRHDNAPAMIRDLLEDAAAERAEWLADDYLNERKTGFLASEQLVPVSTRRAEFQRLMKRLVRENDVAVPARAGTIRVKDVAIRKGQGTASLGLTRYFVLIEGPLADGSDDLIIELKRARRSALAGLVPPSPFGSGSEGERIVHAQQVQLVRGDVFYASIRFEGKSFISRERAPFRDDIDLDELSKGGWKDYAEICGRSIAHAHALSDETGRIDYDVEPKIVEAMQPFELFIDDIIGFAEEAAARLHADHKAFRKDRKLGAFREAGMAHRR